MYVIVIFIKSDREETSLVIDVMKVVNKCKKINLDLIFLVDRHFLLI